jgi:putative ubiquitin-RnfH superfamily antitoxin RatB of RatAB toxin-antitoxin module
MSKCCRVVCDTQNGIRECVLQLPEAATIAAVLEAARPVLGEWAADWDSAVTGIYGRIYTRQHVPADGDRIELYRALHVDPRCSRRARAAKASASRARRGSGEA